MPGIYFSSKQMFSSKIYVLAIVLMYLISQLVPCPQNDMIQLTVNTFKIKKLTIYDISSKIIRL